MAIQVADTGPTGLTHQYSTVYENAPDDYEDIDGPEAYIPPSEVLISSKRDYSRNPGVGNYEEPFQALPKVRPLGSRNEQMVLVRPNLCTGQMKTCIYVGKSKIS